MSNANVTVDHSQGLDAVLAERLKALSLEQKVRLLTGADIWALHPEPAVGLRRLVTSDGPAGVRGERWDERDPSANIPSPTALAASWDEQRVARIGGLLAGESRRKGVDVLLAPTVNLHRTPYGGRHFECLSEDPLLTARIGAAYVRGLQAGGVAATVKHFVANDSETERFTVNVVVDERTLRELYLAPFEAIVRDAGAWAVMAAYNSVNGTTMTENPLLREVLKHEWGFDGVVMSDWYAARAVAAAGDGLLDLVMPGPTGPWGKALLDAVAAGDIPESAVDDHLLRLLRLAARVGALDGIDPATPTATPLPDNEVAAELRSAAAAGMVLAHNADGLLPLEPTTLRTIAVVGPNAAHARTLGGGSATVFPPHVVSPLQGLRAALGDSVAVTTASGGAASERLPIAAAEWLSLPDHGGPGVEVRFFGADGTQLGRQQRRAASLLWWGPIEEDLDASQVDRLEVRTRLRVPESGAYRLGASGLGSVTLTVDDRTVLDDTIALPPGVDVVEGIMKPPQRHVALDLDADRDVEVLLSYRPTGGATLGGSEVTMLTLQLNVAPQHDEQAEFDRAVQLTGEADVAVVVVGTTEEVESEGFDRTSLMLPGRQDDLVRAVAAANPRTIVVVNAGAPVLLPWADDVAAVLLAWFPGQEFGHALADVLLGKAEPGGRLPVTWPATEQGLPTTTPTDGVLAYDEGLLIGYRWYDDQGREPHYRFGHGLGYTSWGYRHVAAELDQDGTVTLQVRLQNTGTRPGREVVQVYASRPDSTVPRPRRWLVGFAAASAAAGEELTVPVVAPLRALQHWDDTTHTWRTEPGTFDLHVGPSSGDLPLHTAIEIPGS